MIDASSGGGAARRARAWLRAPAFVWLVAVAVRLAAVVALGTARDAEGLGSWEFGHEAACLAESLRGGGPYGDPWCHGTGPSAWLTPVYPALVALCLEAGGGVGARAAWMLFALHAVVSAFTALLAGRVARAIAGERAGVLAAWIFALHPLAIWFAAETVWDTTLVALALAGLVALVVAPSCGGSARAALAGALAGAGVLLNPALLAAVPPVLAAIVAREPRGARVRPALAFALAVLAPCAPWMARNALVLGSPALRTNYGVELRVGNLGAIAGRHDTRLHPSHSSEELARYRAMGEVAYARWSRDRTLEWIGDHPGRFAALCARRAAQIWLGEPPFLDERTEAGVRAARDPKAWAKWGITLLGGVGAWIALAALWRRASAVRWIGAILVLLPAPYVLTHASERYRYPIEPLVVALLACWIAIVLDGRRRDQGTRRKRTEMLP